jgi:hypothetical protein
MSAASCAGESRITPSMIGGHLNAPRSSRLLTNIIPLPSQNRSGPNNIQHTDRNVSSSHIAGIRCMASGCACVGDRVEVGKLRRLM